MVQFLSFAVSCAVRGNVPLQSCSCLCQNRMKEKNLSFSANSEKAGFAVIAYSKHLYLAGATIFFVPINIYTSTVFKDLHSQLGNTLVHLAWVLFVSHFTWSFKKYISFFLIHHNWIISDIFNWICFSGVNTERLFIQYWQRNQKRLKWEQTLHMNAFSRFSTSQWKIQVITKGGAIKWHRSCESHKKHAADKDPLSDGCTGTKTQRWFPESKAAGITQQL